MSNFLQSVVDKVVKEFSGDLHHVSIIFPNRRAGLFFKERLAKSIKKPKLLPQVTTLEDFASRMTSLVLADRLSLVYQLYEVFRRYDPHIESFDRFYFWGEILLADFSELDMAMVNAADLFSNLKDLKSIEAGYDYLSDEQKEIISRFWESFTYDTENDSVSGSQEEFLRFWNKLLPVYHDFRTELLGQNLAYDGLLYRKIAEDLRQSTSETGSKKYVFVGLNALKNAELSIVSQLVKRGEAIAYWDTDQYYLHNEVQEAGMFLRKYQRLATLKDTFSEKVPDHFHTGTKRRIQIHGVPLEVGQAKKVGEYLQELSQTKGFDPERCVVVLADEHLLFPVLHALPQSLSKVNVTMGYPLRNTSLYSFVEHLLSLQLEKKKEGESYLYHFESLLALLRHPYIKHHGAAKAEQNILQIKKSNAVYVSSSELIGEDDFFKKLLAPVKDVPDLFNYLQLWSTLIHQLLLNDEAELTNTVESEAGQVEVAEPNSEQEEAATVDVPMLEQELLYHFYIHLNRIKSLTQERQFDFELPAFIKLLRQIFQSLRVPFTGEPLRGLQIMGMLETRNLDFEHVFILSMNEGIMPAPDSQNSFIPSNLKKGFGLFGQDQQDAFYAHAFFRLLHHAKNVHLFYNTEDTSRLKGEMSRFLYQIYYESALAKDGTLHFPDALGDYTIQRDFLSMQLAPTAIQSISIQKTEEVWKSLSRYQKNNQSGMSAGMLTPSALNSYLDCRLKFYYQYVARLHEADEVEEELDAKVFGNILHKTMEVLYKNFVEHKGSNRVEAEDCLQLKSRMLDTAILKGFEEHYKQENKEGFTFEGRNIIAREIVRKMAKQILDLDSRYAPFEIISLEVRGKEGYYASQEFDVNGEHVCVPLKGIIDRVDHKEGVVRVLDYKTGRDERSIADIPSLFDREHTSRNKAAMQALFYAWLYDENHNATDKQIVPGLINASELFSQDFDPHLKIDKHEVNNFANYRDDFLEGLKGLLQEIFNKDVPFDQTTDQKKCGFCPYANICY
ncbi:PD-(D/E)XK nuclease family protein [Porifericola rhodea]|uniref:PD-(D/E)XK nuclease family protein n=1 Tax=Porifericola rhodea TaxID=930972 RepID=UPI002665A86D|nr:PD-(D/E)XK nuclease family protein [Porifericola rhodea]WKN32165.1 PD-(D/E)XK nuclease family protein [Porifericola rhodea]